jgi:transposase
MGAKFRFPEGTTEKLKAAMKKAKSKDEYRRVLCLWLRHGLGLRAPEVAKALGWSINFVRQVQSAYAHTGEEAFRAPGRSWRRRNLLSIDAEEAVLRRLRENAWPNSIMDFRTVHRAVESAVGRPVAASIVNRMLTRHGWGRQATVFVAQHRTPASMAAAMQPPVRTRSGVWYMPLDESEEWKAILQRLRGTEKATER